MPWVEVISLLQQTPAEKCSEQIRPMLVLIPAPPPCSLVALGCPTGPPPSAFCLHLGPCPPPLRPGGGRARSPHTPPAGGCSSSPPWQCGYLGVKTQKYENTAQSLLSDLQNQPAHSAWTPSPGRWPLSAVLAGQRRDGRHSAPAREASGSLMEEQRTGQSLGLEGMGCS